MAFETGQYFSRMPRNEIEHFLDGHNKLSAPGVAQRPGQWRHAIVDRVILQVRLGSQADFSYFRPLVPAILWLGKYVRM